MSELDATRLLKIFNEASLKRILYLLTYLVIKVSTCKISTIHWTISFRPRKNRYETIRYRNSTEAWKFSELKNFCFSKIFDFSRNFRKILRKIRNLATMTKRKKISTKTRKFPNLGREIFFSYRTVDRLTSKFCRWLIIWHQELVASKTRGQPNQ